MACLEPIRSQMSAILARLSSALPSPRTTSGPSFDSNGRGWPMSILSSNPSADTQGATSYRPLSDTMLVDSFSIESLVADNPQELAASRRGRSKAPHVLPSGRHSCAPIIVNSSTRASMCLAGTNTSGSSMAPPTPKRADTEPSPAEMARYHCDLGVPGSSTAGRFLSPPVQWGHIVYEPQSTTSPTGPCSSPPVHSNHSPAALISLDVERDQTRSRTPSPARKFAWDTLVPWHSGSGPRQMSEYNTLDELPPLDPISAHSLQAGDRPGLISSQ